MSENIGHLEENNQSVLRRIANYIGGGMAVALAAEVGYVEVEEPEGAYQVGEFSVSAPITSVEELTGWLQETPETTAV
jgi:hypothetical protein